MRWPCGCATISVAQQLPALARRGTTVGNDYFVIVEGSSTPAESPQQVAEVLIRVRAKNQDARFLVRGATADQEAEGREMVEAWLRQLS